MSRRGSQKNWSTVAPAGVHADRVRQLSELGTKQQAHAEWHAQSDRGAREQGRISWKCNENGHPAHQRRAKPERVRPCPLAHSCISKPPWGWPHPDLVVPSPASPSHQLPAAADTLAVSAAPRLSIRQRALEPNSASVSSAKSSAQRVVEPSVPAPDADAANISSDRVVPAAVTGTEKETEMPRRVSLSWAPRRGRRCRAGVAAQSAGMDDAARDCRGGRRREDRGGGGGEAVEGSVHLGAGQPDPPFRPTPLTRVHVKRHELSVIWFRSNPALSRNPPKEKPQKESNIEDAARRPTL